MSIRDAINRILEQNAQQQIRLETVPNNGTFGAYDEWICVTSTNPQQATGAVNLIVNGSGTTTIVGNGVPFFVSGSQKFTANTGAAVYVQRAQRKELLTNLGAAGRDFPNNGASFSDIWEDAPSIVLALGQWAILDNNLQWNVQPFGVFPGGLEGPFGYAASRKEFAGRYYELAYRFNASAGNTSLEIVGELGANSGAYENGPPFSHSAVAIRGSARVGDTFQLATRDSSLGATNYNQAQVQGQPRWTLCLRASLACTITGNISVIRQGF